MKLIIVPVPLTHEKSLSQTQMRFFSPFFRQSYVFAEL